MSKKHYLCTPIKNKGSEKEKRKRIEVGEGRRNNIRQYDLEGIGKR